MTRVATVVLTASLLGGCSGGVDDPTTGAESDVSQRPAPPDRAEYEAAHGEVGATEGQSAKGALAFGAMIPLAAACAASVEEEPSW
jgi:hypothetical protein